MLKATIHKLGKAYIDRIVGQQVAAHKFSRLNERPLEYGFVFEQIGKVRPRTILDVGTGQSALPQLMAVCGPEVTAIDNVADYWKEAGSYNRHWRVIDDDIRKPKLQGQWDLVTCISVIEHIDDHNAAFYHMAKFLKPGGHLIVTTPYNETRYVPDVYKLADSAYGRDEAYGCRSTSRKELNGWIAATGVKLVEQRFYQVWTGDVWTQGEMLLHPAQTTRDQPHQLSLMLFTR